MKKTLLIFGFLMAGFAFGQTQLYLNTFEGAPGFNLNTTDESSSVAGYNPWTINNVYLGGTGSFLCLGIIPTNFTVPASATQPAGITNNPTSQYLHVTPQIALDVGGTIPAASYVASDGLCITGPQNTFAAMSSDINTTGYDSVSLDFWWMCGGNLLYYGELYYSTDGGTTWTVVNNPSTGTSLWNAEVNWVNEVMTDANWDGQTTLRFGFRFIMGNLILGNELDPGFAIDDIEVIGYTFCSETTGTLTTTTCDSLVSPSGNYVYNTTGMYMDTIMNTLGCDSVITVDVTINTVDNNVTQAGNDLTADQVGGSYQWLDCNNGMSAIVGSTSQTYTATGNGDYAVEVTNSGCVDTSGCFNIAGIGFADNVFGGLLKLYPNPTNGIFYIEFSDALDEIEVSVRNIEGKLISKNLFTDNGLVTFELTGEKGVYIIEVVAGEKRQHYRVVKQ
jgi:Secretion system C-terminal sorting domain